MMEKGAIPSQKDPNWHQKKLKPWMHHDGLDLGKKYKSQAEGMSDPFQKVYAYEEACKMFLKVLEIKVSMSEERYLLCSPIPDGYPLWYRTRMTRQGLCWISAARR